MDMWDDELGWIPPEDLMEVAYSIQTTTSGTLGELRKSTPDRIEDVKTAVDILISIGVVKKNEHRFGYSLVEEFEEDLKQASIKERPLVLRRALNQYEPFTLFIDLVEKGYAPQEAADKVCCKFGVSAKPNIVREMFIEYGDYCDIIAADSYNENSILQKVRAKISAPNIKLSRITLSISLSQLLRGIF